MALPSVYVFLRQELDRRGGLGSLLDTVIDTLVIWALEGTDPDAGKFMNRDEVLSRIAEELPAAKPLIERRLARRLKAVSAKSYPGGRAVRWHRKDGLYCLPYETRSVIELDNAADEALRIDMLSSITKRVTEADESFSVQDAELGARIVMRALQLAYESEGLEFAKFLELRGADSDFPTIADHLRAAIDDLAPRNRRRAEILRACLTASHAVLHASVATERQYLSRLSRTYALLFTLRADPQLVHYFQRMAANFYLYIGADQLVRAISERYLPDADCSTRIMLKMAADAGATLVLTEPVLNEVVTHLRACDKEYANYVAPIERDLTLDIVRNIPRILLRAYCYTKFDTVPHPKAPRSWQQYVAHLLDYDDLYHSRGYIAVRRYLTAEFRMKYVATRELEATVDQQELNDLADQLLKIKAGIATPTGAKALARNDALLALAVYGRRTARSEDTGGSIFGAKTWWLTDEWHILKYTTDLIDRHGDVGYMMRPDFLLNFIALSPNTVQVRATYANVFPSMLGIRMARRMDENAFHELMSTVKGFEDWDVGRRVAAIQTLADRLKGDFEKWYVASTRTQQRRAKR
jgi:hypothetical protein